MTTTDHRVYRSLLRLYPRRFRDTYGDDLVQAFEDLMAALGTGAAWRRTAVDLLVTVPRYRLESIMNERLSAITLNVAIALLALGGIASYFTDLYPGAVLLIAAVALAVVQRGTLARSIRTLDSSRRRFRLRIGAVLATVFVVLYATFGLWVDDSWSIRETLVTTVGVLALLAGIAFIIAGLLTPRSDRTTAPVVTPG